MKNSKEFYMDKKDMNAIERDRYDRRMATRRKGMFTNIIVIGVIVAVVIAIIVVAVSMGKKDKTADTDPTVTATVSSDATQASTQQSTQGSSNTPTQSAQGGQSQSETQAGIQYSTDVQTPTQSSGQQSTEQSGGSSVEEINGEQVYIDKKHTAPENSGSAGYYTAYGSSPEGGFNWNYDADNGNFTVACNYNFDQHQYGFAFYGVSPGTANVTLYYYDTAGNWTPVNLTVNVDNNLNVTVG